MVPASNVDAVSNRLKMIRVDACWITTDVIEFFSLWNRPYEMFIRYTMSAWDMPIEAKLAIAMSLRGHPDPAVAIAINFRKKPCELCVSHLYNFTMQFVSPN